MVFPRNVRMERELGRAMVLGMEAIDGTVGLGYGWVDMRESGDA
jgi:hypothetical protein